MLNCFSFRSQHAVVASLVLFWAIPTSAVPWGTEGTNLISGPAHFTGAEHLESRIDADFGSTDFNVVAWIKTSSGGTIFSKHTAQGERWMPHSKSLFIYRAGTVAFDVGHVGQVESKRMVHNNAWHHVALTYQKSNNQASIYVDGVLDGQIVMKIIPDPDGHVIKVGHTGLDFGGNFRGYMREVKVSPTMLTQEDVLKVYQAQVDTEAWTHVYAMVNLRAHSHMHLMVVPSRSRRSEDMHPPDVHPDAPMMPSAATTLDGPSAAVLFGTMNAGVNDTIAREAPHKPDKRNQASMQDSRESQTKMREGVQERAKKKESSETIEVRRVEQDAPAKKAPAAQEPLAQPPIVEISEEVKKATEAEAKKTEAEKAEAEKAADDAVATKTAEDVAAAKQIENDAEAKNAEDEVAATKAAEDETAATKAAEDEAAVTKAAEEATAATKAAEDEAAATKAAEDETAATKAAEEATAATKAAEDEAAVTKKAEAEAEAEAAIEEAKSEAPITETDEEEDEIAEIEAAAKRVVEDGAMLQKEDDAAKKAAEADVLKQDAEAEIAEAAGEAAATQQ